MLLQGRGDSTTGLGMGRDDDCEVLDEHTKNEEVEGGGLC